MENTVLCLLALQQSGGSGGQLFQLPHAGIDTLGDRRRFQPLGQFGNDNLAHRFRIHRLGQHLQRKQVVVAIHDQAGQEIGLAEDDAISVGVAHHSLAISDRVLNALPQQARRRSLTASLEIMRIAICEALL